MSSQLRRPQARLGDSNLTNLMICERERLLMARGRGFLLNGTTVSGRSVHVV